MAVSRWAGETGFAEVAASRRNMTQYLSKNGTDEETFALDIQQALCLETVQEGIKIHLVTLLQEYASVLLPTGSSAEQAVGSLLGIFHQPAISERAYILRGQILVATTSIAVQYDFQRDHASLFAQLVETLLEVICHTGKASSSHLRKTACCCLQELEINLPCMLRYKMEYIYQLAQMETGTCGQGYLLLLVTTLRHTLQHLQLQHSQSPGCLTDLLSNRTEPLKPYLIPTDIYDCTLMNMIQDGSKLGVVDVRELRRLVAYVMDHIHLLTTPAQAHLLAMLAHVIDAVPDISPSIFKWAIMRNTRSYNVQMLSLMFVLKDLFGEALVGADDESRLYQTVLAGMNHPLLTLTQRMLLTEWLTQNTQLSQTLTWPGLISSAQLNQIFPRVFDGTDTQLKKLYLLSRLLPKILPEDELEEVSVGCVAGLHEFVERGMGGRHATALFQSLYGFYQNHPHPESVDNIKWILIRLGQNHGRLALRVLNFVEAVQLLHPESSLGSEVLSSLVTAITVESVSANSLTQIQHHLMVLQRIAMETSIQPQVVVNYLQTLLDQENMLEQGDWPTGTQVLAVCRALIQYHNINTIFVGLGEVLFQFSQKHRDIDIRDRAAFYYTLITSLAPNKVSSLLKQRATITKDTEGLANFVMKNNKFPACHYVNRVQQPLLALTRAPVSHKETMETSLEPSMDVEVADILTKYKEYLNNETKLQYVELKFNLHFVPEADDAYRELFALVLHFQPSRHYENVPDINVPYLDRSEDAGQDCYPVNVVLQPRQPVPTQFNVEAVFTGKESLTWSTDVKGVSVGLEDLWRPLPLPDTLQRHDESELFDQLWQSLTDPKPDSRGDESLESVFCLNMTPSYVNDLLNTRWKCLKVRRKSTNVESGDTEKNITSIEEREVEQLGIFLSPDCHLLMRLKMEEKRVVVTMVTDHSMVLPLVCDYLRKLEDIARTQ